MTVVLTGDNTSIMPYIIIMAITLVVIIGIFVYRKKK